MYIVWDKQINVKEFEEKNGIRSYKYKKIFSEWIEEILGDTSSIINIKIEDNKKSYGTTKPVIRTDILKFQIELSSDLLCDIYSNKSKAIFQHEIYHCKDILIQYMNGIIDRKLLSSKIRTTYDYILDLSLKEWSEFYAVYFTTINNDWYETYDIELDIDSIINVIDAIHKNNRKGFFMQLPDDMLYTIRYFIYDLVTMIGIYLGTENFEIVKKYAESNEKYIADYFYHILDILKSKLSQYPVWMSKEEFINLGKEFFSILSYNKIHFSTDDLHDKFFFKCDI